MGTDIHLWVEILQEGRWMFANDHQIRREDGDIWVEWARPFRDRNYRLFALLADIRNYAAAITPISFPRGPPDDVSEVGRLIVEDGMRGDLHTFSWLTLEELLDHDWGDVCEVDRGYVVPEELDSFMRDGRAPSGVESVLNERHVAAVERAWTFAEMAGAFHDELLPLLKSLGAPDRVRIVFCFDS